jgi:Tissue inhibitor of metalloproteinase
MKLSNHSKSNLTTRSINHKYTSVFRSLQLLITVIGTFFIGSSTSLAGTCKCLPPVSVQQSVEQAMMVFRGKVVSVKTITFLPEGYQYRQVRFLMKRLWKGKNQLHTTLGTEMENGYCSYSFTKGKEYLVYTHRDLFDVTKCSGAKPWESVSGKEQEQLGKGQDIAGN